VKPIIRRSLIGTLAGAAASAALVATAGHVGLYLLFGAAIGAAFSASPGQARGAYLDNMMAAGALGVPLWGIFSVIALPLLSGQMPEWSAAQMREHFPALVGWVLYGVTLGLLGQTLNDVAERLLGPEPAPKPATPKPKKRILILGGGFAGMKTAECLEKELAKDPTVIISLVSETNALLFTPMLAEVAGSSLEPSHISTPLRTTLHRTEFVRGRVASVDLQNRFVVLDADMGGNECCHSELAYDQLVLALGAVSHYLGLTNVQKLAFDFKSLVDAIRIRNHVIEMFERADRENDRRRAGRGLPSSLPAEASPVSNSPAP
jgi:NADH:ubiquinone reductase (H+-translocating)